MKWERPLSTSVLRVLGYGFKHYVARIGWGVDLRVGVLILGMIADRAEIGLFAVASGMMMRFFLISNSVFSPLLTRSVAEREGRPDLVAFCGRVTTWVTAAGLALLLTFSVPIVRLLLSSEFLPIVPLIWIIAPGILAYAGAVILNAYFRAINRPGICSWTIGIGLIATLLVVSLLYPIIGVHAAAWGMTIGLVARSAFLSIAYYRRSRTVPPMIRPFQRGDLARALLLTETALSRAPRHSSPEDGSV